MLWGGKMNKNIWIALAIIFFVIASFETALIAWSWSLASEEIENEKICVLEICKDGTSWSYDEVYKVCYCYNGDELYKTQELG